MRESQEKVLELLKTTNNGLYITYDLDKATEWLTEIIEYIPKDKKIYVSGIFGMRCGIHTDWVYCEGIYPDTSSEIIKKKVKQIFDTEIVNIPNKARSIYGIY